MKIKFKYIILAVFLLIGLIFYLGWHFGTSKQRSLQTISENAYKKELKRLTITLDNKTAFLTTTEQVLETERQARKAGDIERKELKALNIKQANEINRLKLRVDTLIEDVNHNGQIIDILNSQITNFDNNLDTVSRFKAIKLPFEFKKDDTWLSLKGNFNSQGKLDISLGLDFSADLIAGIDKTTKQNTVILKTDCPYIKTVTFKSIKLDSPKDKKYGIGIQFGYGITRSGLSPFVGVGLQYSLIKF